MANVYGNSNSGSCGPSGGNILPAPKQTVVPARAVASNPNVFRSGENAAKSFDPRDFYTRREVDRYLNDKADTVNIYYKEYLYTKQEIDNKLQALNLSSYTTESYVDDQISFSVNQINSNINSNYYSKTQLYTKTQIDSLINSVSTNADYISKSPSNVDDVTITPQTGSLSISLLVKASNNLATTTVQRWENSSTDFLAGIYADGKATFTNLVNMGENVDSNGVALNTNERRIAGVADPVNNLDAVNKTYMERFITTTIDDVLTDSDENYLIDALEY